jgi:hypothetical protein
MFMFTWLKCNRFGFLQINITSCIILNIIRLYQNDWLSQTFEQGTAKLFFVVVAACKDFKASPWAARATYELKMIAEESQWLKVLDQLDQSSSYRCYSSRLSIAIGVNVVSEWLEDQAVQCIASTAVGKPCLGQEMSYCTSPGRCLANLLFREDAKFHATWTHIAAIVLILRFSTETLAKSNASEMDHGMKTCFDQYAPYPRKFQCCAWALRLAIRIGGRTNQALNERKL